MTAEEAQWQAGRELRDAIRYRGRTSQQAEEKAKAFCRTHGVDPDMVVRYIWPSPPFQVIAFGGHPDDSPVLPGPTEVRAWQDVIRMVR